VGPAERHAGLENKSIFVEDQNGGSGTKAVDGKPTRGQGGFPDERAFGGMFQTYRGVGRTHATTERATRGTRSPTGTPNLTRGEKNSADEKAGTGNLGIALDY